MPTYNQNEFAPMAQTGLGGQTIDVMHPLARNLEIFLPMTSQYCTSLAADKITAQDISGHKHHAKINRGVNVGTKVLNQGTYFSGGTHLVDNGAYYEIPAHAGLSCYNLNKYSMSFWVYDNGGNQSMMVGIDSNGDYRIRLQWYPGSNNMNPYLSYREGAAWQIARMGTAGEGEDFSDVTIWKNRLWHFGMSIDLTRPDPVAGSAYLNEQVRMYVNGYEFPVFYNAGWSGNPPDVQEASLTRRIGDGATYFGFHSTLWLRDMMAWQERVINPEEFKYIYHAGASLAEEMIGVE